MNSATVPLLHSAPDWALQVAHRLETGQATPWDLLWDDPAQVMTRARMTPDPWQSEVLSSPQMRTLLLCGRQCGKSQAAAALALLTALREPGSLTLLLSPSQRQSGELFRDKVLPLWRALDYPHRRRDPTQLTVELANGSRIISLPESEGGIRGFSGVALLVIDEAARVSESLYAAVRPMLATSRGRLLALSTPFGKRGWFYDAWVSRQQWQRIEVPATACPRIPADFLEEEAIALGPRWFRQEYLCSFEDVIDSVFSHADVAAAMTNEVRPLFG